MVLALDAPVAAISGGSSHWHGARAQRGHRAVWGRQLQANTLQGYKINTWGVGTAWKLKILTVKTLTVCPQPNLEFAWGRFCAISYPSSRLSPPSIRASHTQPDSFGMVTDTPFCGSLKGRWPGQFQTSWEVQAGGLGGTFPPCFPDLSRQISSRMKALESHFHTTPRGQEHWREQQREELPCNTSKMITI